MASPAHLRALARIEPKLGREEVSPGFAVRFQRGAHREESTVPESGAGVCMNQLL